MLQKFLKNGLNTLHATEYLPINCLLLLFYVTSNFEVFDKNSVEKDKSICIFIYFRYTTTTFNRPIEKIISVKQMVAHLT